jgi:hypothetical protein
MNDPQLSTISRGGPLWFPLPAAFPGAGMFASIDCLLRKPGADMTVLLVIAISEPEGREISALETGEIQFGFVPVRGMGFFTFTAVKDGTTLAFDAPYNLSLDHDVDAVIASRSKVMNAAEPKLEFVVLLFEWETQKIVGLRSCAAPTSWNIELCDQLEHLSPTMQLATSADITSQVYSLYPDPMSIHMSTNRFRTPAKD